jgi:hypothetical protein
MEESKKGGKGEKRAEAGAEAICEASMVRAIGRSEKGEDDTLGDCVTD